MYALLLLNLIIPFVMILVGSMLKAHPVTDMNTHNGYNTPTSRKSQAHWDYAQTIAPDIFISNGIKTGITEAAISILMFVLRIPVVACVVSGTVVGFAFLIWSFYKTDSKIKAKFTGK